MTDATNHNHCDNHDGDPINEPASAECLEMTSLEGDIFMVVATANAAEGGPVTTEWVTEKLGKRSEGVAAMIASTNPDAIADILNGLHRKGRVA